MDANELFNGGKFLKSEDVEAAGGELSLTISKVERKEYEDNGKKEVKGVLSFLEDDRQLSLNVTNTNVLIGMYGASGIDVAWIGKKVTLWVDPNVSFSGKIVKGLRIRNVNAKEQMVTAFWTKANELFLTPDEGRAILKENGGDFAKALESLKGDI